MPISRNRDAFNTVWTGPRFIEGQTIIEYNGTQAFEVDSTPGTAVFQVDTSTGTVTVTGTLAQTGAQTITSASANALAVGPSGTTNPTFQVAANVASAATGVKVTGSAAAAGVNILALSSGTDENFNIDAKGTGDLRLQSLGGTTAGYVRMGTSGWTSGLIVNSTSLIGLTVGPNGSTNPSFTVRTNIASTATGVRVQGRAAAAGASIDVTSSGTDENLTVDGKGAGTLSLNSTATGLVQQNGIPIPKYVFLTFPQFSQAAATYGVTGAVWINDALGGTYKVVSVTEAHTTASTSGTLQVEVLTGTTAPGSGTNQLTGTVSLAGTANTVLTGTVTGSPTTIAAGNRLGLVFAGTVTNLIGCVVSVVLQRIS